MAEELEVTQARLEANLKTAYWALMDAAVAYTRKAEPNSADDSYFRKLVAIARKAVAAEDVWNAFHAMGTPEQRANRTHWHRNGTGLTHKNGAK